jgi:hypothetical protein
MATGEPSGVSAVLLDAAQRYRGGDRTAAAHTARRLADRFSGRLTVVDTAVRCAVLPLLAAAWTQGWSPQDVHQLARRRLDALGAGYTMDAIAAETAQRAAAGMSERWHDQLCRIGAVVWWRTGQGQPDPGHLAQWARRHRRSLAQALGTVIEVLALLLALPRLPTIAPPPGAPPPRGVDQKVLARVRGLLAKAESTTFAEEAEALSAKAQELMSRYCLERIAVAADRGTAAPPCSVRRLWLDSPYVAAKALLVDAVAEANRCRAVLYEKLGFTTVLGDEVDLELVEVLTTSLLVQATRAMVSAGHRTTGPGRSRSFRQSFLVAYATRIRERLIAARDAGTAAAVPDPDRLLPVLAARERVVDDVFESMFSASVIRSVGVGNAAGWQAGRAAADLAELATRRAVGSAER